MPPASKKDNELKAHLEDNKLDLSLMQHEVITPSLVRQIAGLPKATEVDLSCNRLQTLSPQFCSLTQITHLDLSKNSIVELPEEIAQMTSLRHLDLSGNKIVSLPLGFGALENLRWLDLKDNPLDPHLSSIAGDCLDKKQCTNAAKQVCVYMRTLAEAHERALEKKKKKRDNLDEKKQRKKEEKEEAIREEQKAAKKVEREKKRKEYEEKRLREQKLVENIGPMGDRRDTDSEAEAELHRRSTRTKTSSSSSIFSAILGVVKLFLLLLLLALALSFAVVGWCQGSRRLASPICVSARDGVDRLRLAFPDLAGRLDFDDFCDATANRTRDALEAGKVRFADLSAALRPWAEKAFVFYDERVAPFLTVAREKSHCIFCHAYEDASTFLNERVLPPLRSLYAQLRDWLTRSLKIAAEFFKTHCRPTLIIVRDHVIEVYLLLMDHMMRILDVYVFPGCEKIFASAADVFNSLKTTTA